uniref:Putative secreted protein n=1 Tax=Ixodes ricinus TaxID=34613 RepID=A0A6B0UVM8_IXORI
MSRVTLRTLFTRRSKSWPWLVVSLLVGLNRGSSTRMRLLWNSTTTSLGLVPYLDMEAWSETVRTRLRMAISRPCILCSTWASVALLLITEAVRPSTLGQRPCSTTSMQRMISLYVCCFTARWHSSRMSRFTRDSGRKAWCRMILKISGVITST